MAIMLWVNGTITDKMGTDKYLQGFANFTFEGYFLTSPLMGSVLDIETATKHLRSLVESHPRLTVVMHHL